MNRDTVRLSDIEDAIAAIRSHVSRGSLSDSLVFDAVRMRLIEIGEAVKSISQELLEGEPDIPWRQITRMRDYLSHRYFDTLVDPIKVVIDRDLEPLEQAVIRLEALLESDTDTE